ncbi:hypothetical protein [Agromyces sp. NPDC056965]|uniref:hypothetical protein n=1 Tax=Agromyces sp. NPDC056965 TaxID=3345983 RepID=UPI003628CD2D
MSTSSLHQGWHARLSLVSDPAELKSHGSKGVVIMGVSIALAAVGLVLGLATVTVLGWVMFAVGVVAAGVWALVSMNSRTASALTGDDLIEIVVADEGVVVQGGLAVPWGEISEVRYRWTGPITVTGSGAAGSGADLATSALDAAGIDRGMKQIEIRLSDYPSVKARAVSKTQKLVLFGPMLGDPGYLHVGLHGRSDAEVRAVLELVADQAERHAIAFTRQS